MFRTRGSWNRPALNTCAGFLSIGGESNTAFWESVGRRVVGRVWETRTKLVGRDAGELVLRATRTVSNDQAQPLLHVDGVYRADVFT